MSDHWQKVNMLLAAAVLCFSIKDFLVIVLTCRRKRLRKEKIKRLGGVDVNGVSSTAP